MKILAIDNLVFKLPDTFKGSFSDALRALARYHDGSPTAIRQKKQPGGRLTRKTWDAFLSVVDKGGCLACIASLQKWTGKTWRKFPLEKGWKKLKSRKS
jgi:hypothetical protein